MRIPIGSVLCLLFCFGCTVYETPGPAVVSGPPVVNDPSVVVIESEPPPAERIYVYDPGYPPGTYYYHDQYYYNGYRYPQQVFVTKVVNVNVQQNKYVNVQENKTVTNNIVIHNQTTVVKKDPKKPGPHPPAANQGNGRPDRQ